MAAEEASSNLVDGGRRPRPGRSARDFALARLARRAHSVGELSKKMTLAGYAADAVAQTIDELLTRGYLDDQAFALDFARAKAKRSHWGPGRIESSLQALGVADAVVRAALDAVFPDGEASAARAALGRFIKAARKPEPAERRKAKAYRHLLSKGFAADLVHELVSQEDFGDTERLDDP